MQDRWSSFTAMTVVAVASAGAFWLLRDHWGHMLGLAPYLLFLSCPLTHLFMHRSHGHGASPSDKAHRSGEAPGSGSAVRRGAPSAWR